MTPEEELLIWAAEKLKKAQADKIYGTVTFHVEQGKITRSEIKQLDVPARKINGKTAPRPLQ